MTNLPKELKDKMLKAAKAERMYVERGNGPEAYYSMMKFEVNDDREDCFVMGFHYCYELMLKTHVPKEKVDKLVEALIEMKNMLWTKQAEIHRVLKEFEGENV